MHGQYGSLSWPVLTGLCKDVRVSHVLTAKATTTALIRTLSGETRKESLWSAWHLLLHVVHVGPFLPMAFSTMEEEPARRAR